MAVNYDLNNTGQEVQERLDQVMPNKSDIEQEVLDRQAGDNALQGQIDAINTEIGESGQGGETINGRLDELEAAVGSGGSVDERIAAAEAEIIGGASEDYNTLGKVEGELVDTYRKDETYSKEQLDSLITTPDVEYVSVVATDQTTDVTTLLPNPGAADTVYRVGNWDGTQYDPTVYSLYAWNGSAYILLAVRTSIGEVYDISVNHPDGQGNSAVYTDLANALGSSGANVPVDIRRGGMSIKFIQLVPAKYFVVVTTSDTQPTGTALLSASSVTSGTYEASALTDFSTLPSATGSANAVVYYYDNAGTYTIWTITMASAQGSEYVQYRLMATDWSTTPSDWQGVDAEPAAGSRNLVESGGVIVAIDESMAKITEEIKGKNLYDYNTVGKIDGVINTSGGITTAYNSFTTGLIPIKPNHYYYVNSSAFDGSGANIFRAIRCLAADETTVMKVLAAQTGAEATESFVHYYLPSVDGTNGVKNGQFKTPANAAYLQVTLAPINTTTWQDSFKIMLEDVGDAYNASFEPSPYEDYVTPELKIKNEAIDKDEVPTDGSDKPVCSGGTYDAIQAVNNNLVAFEGKKVTEFGDTPSNENYPSEKLVYDKAVAPLGEVVEMKQSKNLFDKSDIVGDKIVDKTGALKNVGSYTYNKCTGWIPVKPNYYYRISGDTLSTGYYIRCANSDKSTVMKVLAPSTGTEYATDYNMPNSDGTNAAFTLNAQFKTPANAAYVQFNIGVQNKDNTDTAMIEEVGSTYNPDFVPSSYEPYVEPHAVVKAEAIDTDSEPVEDSIKPITSGGVYNALQEFTPITNKKLSVLLIGSSHGVNTISMFPVLAYHAGIDITVGNLYTGSATLGLYSERPARQIPYMADHDVAFGRFAVYENGAWSTKSTTTISYALSEYQWDAIILQRGATEDWWNENTSGFYQHLLDYIKEHCDGYTPKIYFNSGIADATKAVDKTAQIGDTNTLINTAKQQKAEYGIDIIPTAVAVQYARMTCLKNTGYGWMSGGTTYHDMSSDTQHLDTGIGQYVTGCTVFEKIVGDFFNMSVRELAYYPVYADVSGNVVNEGSQYFTAITDYYSRIAKQCAMLAVMDGEYVADHAAALTAKYASLPSTYTITNTLTGCTNSNTATSVGSDEVYMTTLTPNSGLTIQSVTVEMGENDVTSSVYATYEGYYAIRIGVISGNIVITASAS